MLIFISKLKKNVGFSLSSKVFRVLVCVFIEFDVKFYHNNLSHNNKILSLKKVTVMRFLIFYINKSDFFTQRVKIKIKNY
jgi:hypothetical protein